VQTPAGRAVIVGEVNEQSEQSPFRQFVEAMHTFSDDPDPVNLSHYLEASRALEESRSPATHVNDAAA
jgi:hypothetical protein